MKTVSRAQWQEAQALWLEGGFSSEWAPWRHEAAMVAGVVYPPSGSPWDSWDDDQPSQRAILIQAIRDTPTLLHQAIARTGRSTETRSWGTVIRYLLQARDQHRLDLDNEPHPRKEGPTHHEAVQSIAAIMARIEEAR